MLPAMVRVPFQTFLGAILESADAALVQPSAAIPVSAMNTGARFVDRVKIAGLIMLTRELLNSGTAVEGLDLAQPACQRVARR